MNKKNYLFILLWSLMSSVSTLDAQQALTIEECYTLARENYPLTRQYNLIAQSEAYSLENASKGYLPNIALHAQATYQSDVPSIPFDLPGMNPPLVPKDQYKVYGELKQVIYDGGAIKLNKEYASTESLTKQQQLEVELYTLKDRINQLFFGILLIEEQQRQLTLRQKDLELGLSKVEAAIDAGIALKSNSNVLKVELLKVNQQHIELQSTRMAYIDMLSQMIGRTLEENTSFTSPPNVELNTDINRPELKLFDLQAQSLNLKNNQLETANRPKIQLFLQGGLGRPGLNIFDAQLTPYFIGGVGLSWPLVGYYTTNNTRSMNTLEQDQVNLRRQTFLYNTNLQLARQTADINKLKRLLSSDDEIIDLLSSIKNTSLTQMENGVITANDYLTEVNKEDQARQSKILHETQLLMAQYATKTTSGN
jgi:outer membrane protein TolC